MLFAPIFVNLPSLPGILRLGKNTFLFDVNTVSFPTCIQFIFNGKSENPITRTCFKSSYESSIQVIRILYGKMIIIN